MLLGVSAILFASFSQSSTKALQNYSVGSGGTNSSSSSTYQLNASTGDAAGTTSSATKTTKASAIEAQQANVPLAPSLSNGSGTYYNQLGFIINMSGDPTDYTYAVAVSTDNFTTTKYVQLDGTLNTSQVYRTYSAWGSGTGSTMTGLTANTVYMVKVAAMQGQFTNSAFGPAAAQSTVGPQISFSIAPSLINMGDLLPATIVSSGANISVSFATNGASGGKVYIAGKNGGLKSTAVSNTIAAYTGDLTSPAQGFGVQGSGATQSSGGPFSVVSPYGVSGTNVAGPATTFQPIFSTSASVVGASASVILKAKASAQTPAASDYQEILTFVASASF